MRLLVTRPEADAAPLRAALETAGHVVVVKPLLRVEPVPAAAIELDGVQALIATSRNALRALADRGDLGRARGLPLVVVGPGTAALARELGFGQVIEGPASARDLPPVIACRFSPTRGALLHLAGETLAFDLAAALLALGLEVRVATLYRSVPATALSPALCDMLAASLIDGVILMSPATARTYVQLVDRHALAGAIQPLVHFCLSGSVAQPLAALRDVRIEVALRPNAQEMLDLVARVAAQLS